MTADPNPQPSFYDFNLHPSTPMIWWTWDDKEARYAWTNYTL